MASSALIFRLVFPRYDGGSYDGTVIAGKSERLSFYSGDNRLTGYLYTDREPSALVVIAAGFGDGASAHLGEVRRFLSCGYAVLCYDATGVGESEGDGTVGLSQPGLDLRAALDYIESDSALSQLPILLYGHSAGAYGALTCCNDYSRVKAAVAVCPFESPLQLMHDSAKQRVGFLADIEYPFLMLQNDLIFRAAADVSASSCLHDSDVPVLVLEGSRDRLIPKTQRISSYRDRIANPLVTYHIIDDEVRSGHGDLWLSRDAALYRRTCRAAGVDPDPLRASRTDDAFMDEVVDFYQNAVS